MRRVVLQMGVSVDGYVAGVGGNLDWGLLDEHPDVRAWKVAALRKVGTHVVGRVTYEAMAQHWPQATDEYASYMNDSPKVVFSRTLETADWPETRIAHGELAEEMAALKAEEGGDIMAHGGATFVQALSQQGLIDQYNLVIPPVALGSGLPLFKDLSKPLHLELTQSRSFPGGTVINVYESLRPT